jgi:lysophospholipase L1-like esterase
VEEGLQNHQDIFNMAAEDGVHNIVLLGFHYTTGWNGGYNKVIDYTYPLLAELCTNSLVPCQLVDPRMKIKSEHLDWDGTHPNAQGAQILADLILDKLPLFTADF